MAPDAVRAQAPAQFQAVWCAARQTPPAFSVFPEKCEAERRFLVLNDWEAVHALFDGAPPKGWHVVDARELRRLVFPESPGFSGEAAAFPDVQALWRFWQTCAARLDAIPVWALELLADLCESLEEADLSALFAYWATTLEAAAAAPRAWQDTFPAMPSEAAPSRELPSLEDCTPLDPAGIAAYLEPGGPLARLVADYEPRPGQITMLKAVAEAFSQGRHLVVEAGTGIGKSLAYLLPAALWAKSNDVPVVVSTNTKNLQAQLVEKDLPAVLRMIDEARTFPEPAPFRAAVIKGRANYLCLRRLGQLMDDGRFALQRPETRMFASVIAWAATTQDGDLDALTGGGAADLAFLQLLTSSSDDCPGRGCPLHSRCFIQKARHRALRANLVVANHSLVFSELGAEKPVALPPYAQIVFDEAHNLEDAATAFFTEVVSPGAVSSVLRRIASRRGRSSRGALYVLRRRVESGAIGAGREAEFAAAFQVALGAVRGLEGASAVFFRALHALLGRNESPLRYRFPPGAPASAPDEKWGVVREGEGAFLGAIETLRASLETLQGIVQDAAAGELNLAAGDVGDLAAAIARLSALSDTTKMVLDGTDDARVFWVQKALAPGALAEAHAAPINVGDFLATKFYANRSSVILCSATLSVQGSFGYVASRLGLDRIEPGRLATCVAPSPFDYSRQCALLVSTFLPEPNAPDRSYVGELTNLVLQLAVAYGGRTLVLFTSYEMMRQSAELIRGELEKRGISLLTQGEDGSRNRITRVFRQGKGSVLYGTQSFWEGVDVVGDALSCVVMARLPFVSPTEPVTSARCEQIDAAGGRSFFELSIPLAVLKFRQGFGRLIRHRLDCGTVVVADPRVVQKRYGASFLASLPVLARCCTTLQELLDSRKQAPVV